MDQYLNNRRTELLWDLLAGPTAKGGEHVYNLHQLIKDFPQSGILQTLLLYVGEEENLPHAVAYANPGLLYKLVNDPDSLAAIAPGQIIDPANYRAEEYTPAKENSTEEVKLIEDNNDYLLEEPTEAEIAEESPVEIVAATAEEELPVVAEQREEESQIAEQPATDSEGEPENIVEPLIELEEKDIELTHEIDDDIYDEIQSIENISLSDDDDVYDEIQSIEGIDLSNHFTQPTHAQPEPVADDTPDVPPVEEVASEEETISAQEEKEPELADGKINVNVEEEKLILGNIAATDFFVFDRAFGEKKKTDTHTAVPQTMPVKAEKEKMVSRYNDEKMPFSFLWWLDKVRKEHSGIYQPYVEFKLDTTESIKETHAPADELQQQYVENIFHLTSVEELDRSTGEKPVEFDSKRKEDVIIERFIQEVPQIKPQTGEKLDNENKARKSSEDHHEIVTETLAQIYADQMRYPKAIAAYKKLMLKFPEKSRYFASQIEELEKKTN